VTIRLSIVCKMVLRKRLSDARHRNGKWMNVDCPSLSGWTFSKTKEKRRKEEGGHLSAESQGEWKEKGPRKEDKT